MASFVEVLGECATVFQNTPLLYVYCICKEDFPVCPLGLPCVELVCRQVHVSFVDKMTERRISMVPLNNGRVQMEDVFNNARSFALISLRTSCNLKFTDPREQDSPNYECALIWDFDVVPASATAVIRPREISNDEERYDTLPPVDLKTRGHCNCFVYDRQRCIVDFAQPRQEADAVIPLLEELLVGEDSEESDDNDDEYSQQDEEETDEHEQTEPQQTVEYFPIVGSNWEMRYQEGLKKCYNMQVKKQKVQLRVEHEPDNISDCNALKFEVLSDGQSYILGYCGKKKIPKLKRALYHHQVVSLELCNLRRIYYPVISDFRFTAGINIVKMGTWERDDYNNRYNSSIAM
ncbi:hypothetical protein ACROYT_G028037 [Oculina patagonica]